MAMVVQHNLTAMNANRQLGVTTSGQAKSSEKLSSGYRINRAGDDAAGLKISEKMRSQVRGLDKASSNAQDGVSLIQTAEGALNEAHSILQRMNELAVQGANDTNENIDRDAINQELDALTEELDRISQTTQFNKQNLLDGSFKDKNLHVGANVNQKITIGIGNMNAETLGLRSVQKPGEDIKQTGVEFTKFNYGNATHAFDTAKTMSVNISEAQAAFSDEIVNLYTSAKYVQQYDSATKSIYFASLDKTNTARYSTVANAISADTSAAVSKMKDEISTKTADYLTKEAASGEVLSGTSLSGRVAVDTYEIANNSLKAIQDAINKVSEQRSALGAIQNRLEHTIANLDNVAENTQAAESRIRDTDMASEMVEYSKNNILAQAGQSMLAQSNQSTQGVLSLLQ